MARIRSIKPEISTDERFADCSPTARLLFLLMQPHCDDGGVHPAKPRTLKAEVFPMDDAFTAEQISAWVDELVKVKLLGEFEAAGQRYWYVTDWASMQKIEKPSFKYPRPNAPDSAPVPLRLDNDSTTSRRMLDDASPAEGRKEGKGEESKGTEKYCAEPQGDSTPPVAEIPLVDGTEFPISAGLLDEFCIAYPAVEVLQQLRAMRQWCNANKANRKTPRGVLRFVTGWLSKAQDKARRADGPRGLGAPSGGALHADEQFRTAVAA